MRNGPAQGIRLRFDTMVPTERDSLRQFLKFVQETTTVSSRDNGYFQFLK
jgi:hypothetical protein